MAFTQGHLDAIDQAIASGAVRVRYPDGSEIQYRSLDEMVRVRARIAGALGVVAGGASGNPRVSVVTF